MSVAVKNKCYLVLIVMVSFLTCKTSKIDYNKPAPSRTKDEVIEALNKRNIQFNSIAIKADGSFDSPQFGGSGDIQVRIKKDSLIWLVGKKFSIEGFRSIINKDSFYVISRFPKFYAAEDINTIGEMFGMNFSFEDFQELLAGNVFLPDHQISYTQTKNECEILTSIDGFDIKYVVDAYTLNLKQFNVKDRYGRKMFATFDNYEKISKQFLPKTRVYEFYDNNQLHTKLDVTVDEVEFNTDKSMNFSIPSHYERVRF